MAADPKGMMSCRIQGKSVRMPVCLSICPFVHPPPSQPDRRIDEWTDGQMYAQISPVFYRTSSPLEVGRAADPNCHHYIDGQGMGTADHLLPLGNLLRDAKQYLSILLNQDLILSGYFKIFNVEC